MKPTFLTLLILQINSLIDSGKYSDITIDDVHSAIEKRSLLRFIKEKCSKDIDLSLHIDGGDDFETKYEEALYEIYGGYAGDERRKWGVEKQGLCVVLAWTTELIQRYFTKNRVSSL